jgi:hypothetical protein
VPAVRAELGDRLRLIAVPDFASKDRKHSLGAGFLERIGKYHELGSHFGFWGAKVSTIPALREALKEALASAQSGRTAILNVELTK